MKIGKITTDGPMLGTKWTPVWDEMKKLKPGEWLPVEFTKEEEVRSLTSSIRNTMKAAKEHLYRVCIREKVVWIQRKNDAQ